MGIGCRRDPLEANVWYVKAADQGDERATHRIATIRAAADGTTPELAAAGAMRKGKKEKQRFESMPICSGIRGYTDRVQMATRINPNVSASFNVKIENYTCHEVSLLLGTNT